MIVSFLDDLLANAPEEEPLTEAALQRIRDLDLSSCDFVGDSGCVDPDCCHSPLRPENLRTLAKNLAAAAALCRAHRLGFDEGMDRASVGEGYPSTRPWTPGCESSAP